VNQINIAFADVVFNNVGGLADVENVKDELTNLGVHEVDDERARAMTVKYVVPYVAALEPFWSEKTKLAIQYVLTFDQSLVERVVARSLVQLGPAPSSWHLLYEWIWESVFVGESWRLNAGVSFEIVDDVDEASSVRLGWDAQVPSPFVGEAFREFRPTFLPAPEAFSGRTDIRAALEEHWAKRPEN
jgi:hypothetical protein